MSDDYYVWSCPIKKIPKCNVPPRLIGSKFTVSTRRSFAIKRPESPIYLLSSKSNNLAKFETKRAHATSWEYVPKQRDSKPASDPKYKEDKIVTAQKSIEFKTKTVAVKRFRSPTSKKCKIGKLSRCVNRSIQTEQQGVLSHFTSLVDGIGTAVVDNAVPWIPYVGATALAIVLFGYFSKKVEKALCMYNSANELLSTFPLNDIPLVSDGRNTTAEETPISEPPPTTGGAAVDPQTLRLHYNKLVYDDNNVGPSSEVSQIITNETLNLLPTLEKIK